MFACALPVAEISRAYVSIVSASKAREIEASVGLLIAVVSALPAPKTWVARMGSTDAALTGIGPIAEESVVTR